MSDLISRQAAIDALDGEIEITGRTNAEAVKGYVRLVKDRLERLPSAQPEQKTGHWIDTNSKSFEFHKVYKCSECGNTEIEYPESIYRRFRYCPNCGAKMQEVEE